MIFSALKKPKEIPAEISGIRVRHNTRARRMALRVDTQSGDVVLVWPRRASEKSAIRFVDENRGWIEKQREKIVKPKDIHDGMALSVHGKPYRIIHTPGRGVTMFDGDTIVVRGSAEHLSRRLCDFLKKEAGAILTEKSNAKAATLGLKPAGIRIIDPKTRWGSCGPDGKLMYSWRLILAPPEILDYVVAHEVAHRVHMNHGRKFWQLCLSLTENGNASRRWLRDYGQTLMAYR